MANEKWLSDVSKVMSAMKKCLDEDPDKKSLVAYFAFESIITALKQEPTIDAVEVVRCKNCKHFISDICRFDFGLNYSRGDDFCCYGERKDTE